MRYYSVAALVTETPRPSPTLYYPKHRGRSRREHAWAAFRLACLQVTRLPGYDRQAYGARRFRIVRWA